MGFLDDVKEDVKNVIDEGKDKVEESTGIDIDRDGNVGGSEPDSSNSSGSNNGSTGSSGGSGGSSDTESSGGDVSFDTGGSSGGSSGGGDRDVVERDNEEVNVEDIDIPDRSNEDFEQEGPERTAVQSSVTVEDQETTVETESGETISRADQIQRRDEAEEARRNLENEEEFLRDLSEGSRVETQGGDILSRSEALDRVRSRQEQARETEQSIISNVENFDRISQAQKRRQERNRENQDSFDIARENTGVERAFEFNNPLKPGNDLEDTVEVSSEGLEDFLTNPADQSLITGTEIMQGGQDFADNVIDEAGDVKQGFDRAVIDANPLTTFEPGAQQELREGATPEDAIESIGRGAATGGSQLPGLIVATPGATANAFEEDTPSLSEGAATGGELFVEEAESDPLGLVGEEIGEEISEKALFGTAGAVVGKTAGRASSVIGAAPTPDFRNLGTVRGQATFSGGTRVVDNSDTTPDFVNEAGPELLEPEITTVEPDISVESTPDTISEPDTIGTDIFADTPVIDEGAVTESPVSDPIGDVIADAAPEAIAEPVVESRTDPVADVFAEPEVLADVKTEAKPDPIFESRPDPRIDPTPSPNLDPEEDEDFLLGQGSDEISDEFQFQESVGAEILGVTAEERPSNTDIQDPFSLRPVVENNGRDQDRIL